MHSLKFVMRSIFNPKPICYVGDAPFYGKTMKDVFAGNISMTIKGEKQDRYFKVIDGEAFEVIGFVQDIKGDGIMEPTFFEKSALKRWEIGLNASQKVNKILSN